MAVTQPDVILIDLGPTSGFRGINFSTAERMEKSTEVVNQAMGTIRAMAWKTISTVKAIKGSDRPSKVGVKFGIKFDAEIGAVLAKNDAETAISVTLTWEHKDEKVFP